MYTLLRRKLAGLKGEVVDFACDLVQTPSPTLGEGEVAEKVERRLAELEYDKVVHDDLGNVVGIMFGRESEPNVLLVSHMDTVSASTESAWSSPPESAAIRDGRIYGLGTADCKGGVAAQAYAGALLKRSLLPLRGNLIFAATVAEGNGRSVGVRGLIERTLPELGIKPTFAILGEPTGLGLYYGHDGWVELELEVEGVNPFHVDDVAKAIVSSCSGGAGAAETLSVSEPSYEDRGGARRATIMMNRRLFESEIVGSVVDRVRREAIQASSASDTAVNVRVREGRERLYNGRYELVKNVANGWAIDPYDRLVERSRQALSAAGISVHPRKWELGRLGMGTAGGTLVKEFGISTVGYGPGLEEAAHRVDEFVEIDKLVEAVYGTAAIVHSLIGIPVFGWTSDEP